MTIWPDYLSPDEWWKYWGDGASFMLMVSSFAEFLPPIAALLSIIWIVIRIYETQTMQTFLPKSLRLPGWKRNADDD